MLLLIYYNIIKNKHLHKCLCDSPQITKNSTIFKTYETDLEGISNKLGFSKRTFAEWGTQVKKSFDEAGGGLKGFASALSTAFTIKNDDKDFKRTLSGEIVTKENIDSFIPQFTSENASNLAKEIREQSIALVDAKKGWEEYFAILKGRNQEGRNQGYIVDLIKNTDDLSKLTGEDLIKANEAARKSAIDHNAALKQQTLGAKAAAVGMEMFRGVLNTLAFTAVTTAILTMANAIITKFTEIVNVYENGVKKINDLTGEVKSLESEQSSLNDELKTSQERLYELQQIKMPTLFKKDEIENLKEYNKQLEAQIRLKELELELKKKEAKI